jgi:hypothetical protein
MSTTTGLFRQTLHGLLPVTATKTGNSLATIRQHDKAKFIYRISILGQILAQKVLKIVCHSLWKAM